MSRFWTTTLPPLSTSTTSYLADAQSLKQLETMSLECLAILGIRNEPLYLYEPASVKKSDNEGDHHDAKQQDVFGFAEFEASGSGLSIRHEFMMHAALDRLEELLGSPKVFDLVKMHRGTKWLGSLLPMEEYEIYGHVTTTGVKILALIQRESVIPLSKRKDSNIRILCESVHEAFVRYTMNPFTKVRSKIERPCFKFEADVQESIEVYSKSMLVATNS